MIKENILDVIVTSSCRDTIFRAIESFLNNVKYRGEFRFIINIDVCWRGNLKKILKFVKKLRLKAININCRPKGFTSALASTLKQVESPFYFHLEDDWIFLKEIQLDPIVALMRENIRVNHIRFSKRKIRDYNELFYCPPIRKICRPKKENIIIDDINLVKVIAYSANPNISRTSHFQNRWHLKKYNIEQQFCLMNFLMGNKSGYFIFGKIGDEPHIEHIG